MIHAIAPRRTAWACVWALGLTMAAVPAAQAGDEWTPTQAQYGGTPYIVGGISEEQEAQMHKVAREWPLRIIFSERKDNDFVANAQVHVTDRHGATVLELSNTGPMLYAKLPAGNYRITARYNNVTKVRHVNLNGKSGSNVFIHWKGTRNIDPWDGRPMGGDQVPG